MSCYEWERGSIVLSGPDFRRLRAALLSEVNERRASMWAKVESQYPVLRDMMRSTIDGAAHKTRAQKLAFLEGLGCVANEAQGEIYPAGDGAEFTIRECRQMLVALFPTDAKHLWFTGQKLKRPKKADFAPWRPKAIEDLAFETGGECGIALHATSRTVLWGVPENNHAAEHARETRLAKVLFKFLDTVIWTRGTGGVITGNNEDNRASRGAGDGANFIVAAYGPIGARAAADRVSPAAFRSARKAFKAMTTTERINTALDNRANTPTRGN